MPEWISPNQAHCNGAHEEMQAEEQEGQSGSSNGDGNREGRASHFGGRTIRGEDYFPAAADRAEDFVTSETNSSLRSVSLLDNPSGIQSLPVTTPQQQQPEARDNPSGIQSLPEERLRVHQ